MKSIRVIMKCKVSLFRRFLKKSMFLSASFALFLFFIFTFFILSRGLLYAAEHNTGEVKTVYIKNVTSFDFVYIPPGNFIMGSELSDPERDSSDWPAHEVKISEGFWLMKNEVTQSQWRSVTGSNPSYFKNKYVEGGEESELDNPCGDNQKYHSGRDGCPVERVSWHDCVKFIAALNSTETGIYGLPAEAEWEYACRAGSNTSYYWGESPEGNYFWYMDNAYNKPQAVCIKLPNGWGLYDMSGNASEWCSDWAENVYERSGAPAVDPPGPPKGEYKIVRGGNWAVRSQYSRSAARSMQKPENGDMYTGLRLIWRPVLKENKSGR